MFGLKLAAIGFHNGQDQLLLALQPGVPVKVSDLAEAMSVRPSTVSKMLDRLIEKKLMERSRDTRDARATMVTITPEGIEAQTQIRAVWDALEAELTLSLDGDAIDALASDLDDLDKHLAARLRRHR